MYTNIEIEYVYRLCFRRMAEYFSEKITEKRKQGYVPVLVEDFFETIYYVPCNDDGLPKLRYVKILKIPPVILSDFVGETPNVTTLNIDEFMIEINSPLVTYNLDNLKPLWFMWSGKQVYQSKIPLDQLNIKELMIVAQKAIRSREGLVVDEALKNKIYK